MNTLKEIQIWYLYHSGFAIKTASHFLIFDYYSPSNNHFTGLLEDGFINPVQLKDENVLVFASHAHADHFDKRIFHWRNDIKSIQYILSDDIKHLKTCDFSDILPVHFNCTYELEEIQIRTLHSTDKGVAFLVEVDGITLYHAGDLNWWHWNGESKHYNDSMAGQYRHEIDSLQNLKIDFGFVPLDPRLEDKYLLGIDYFAKKTQTKVIFPMHFLDNYSVFDRLDTDSNADNYCDRIKIIQRRGQHFQFHLE